MGIIDKYATLFYIMEKDIEVMSQVPSNNLKHRLIEAFHAFEKKIFNRTSGERIFDSKTRTENPSYVRDNKKIFSEISDDGNALSATFNPLNVKFRGPDEAEHVFRGMREALVSAGLKPKFDSNAKFIYPRRGKRPEGLNIVLTVDLELNEQTLEKISLAGFIFEKNLDERLEEKIKEIRSSGPSKVPGLDNE